MNENTENTLIDEPVPDIAFEPVPVPEPAPEVIPEVVPEAVSDNVPDVVPDTATDGESDADSGDSLGTAPGIAPDTSADDDETVEPSQQMGGEGAGGGFGLMGMEYSGFGMTAEEFRNEYTTITEEYWTPRIESLENAFAIQLFGMMFIAGCLVATLILNFFNRR